jgi:uncharacterized RmlC-like cupin family protein
MRKIFTAVLIGASVLATAAMAADGYMVVPKSEQKFKPGAGNLSMGDALLDHKNAQANITTRDRNGQVEQHADWEDHIFVMDGEANMVLGGTMEKGKTTAPGETRGETVKGGKSFMVHAGDYIYIPVNTPHQMLIAAGKSIKYAVVKTHP